MTYVLVALSYFISYDVISSLIMVGLFYVKAAVWNWIISVHAQFITTICYIKFRPIRVKLRKIFRVWWLKMQFKK